MGTSVMETVHGLHPPIDRRKPTRALCRTRHCARRAWPKLPEVSQCPASVSRSAGWAPRRQLKDSGALDECRLPTIPAHAATRVEPASHAIHMAVLSKCRRRTTVATCGRARAPATG